MEDQNLKDTPDMPEGVASPPEEGQDVPEREPDDRKEGEENDKTRKTGKPSTPGLDKDKSEEDKKENENDKNKNPNKRGRVESSTKEPALPPSPPRGRGRKP